MRVLDTKEFESRRHPRFLGGQKVGKLCARGGSQGMPMKRVEDLRRERDNNERKRSRVSQKERTRELFGMSIAFLFVQETVEGVVAAVKRLKDVSISEKEFREKVETAGPIDHENLVPLRANYYSKDEKLIIYGYMPIGSLSALPHGNRGVSMTLPIWEARSGIALGATRGIAYIHSWGSASPHGDIKSSNILLTKSCEGQVSDFGLAHLVGPIAIPNRVVGYCALEATDARKVSKKKVDAYNFGVWLLELLT
uniref:Protein kinase domain-containing protein n=2 Tax=Vitis vinifera TaxID=29760 RepID=F6GVA5_VITVI